MGVRTRQALSALAVVGLGACGESQRGSDTTPDTVAPDTVALDTLTDALTSDSLDANDALTSDAQDANDTSDPHDVIDAHGDTTGCPIVAWDPSDPNTVATDRGPVRGTSKDGVRTWLGIPYALPPTGPRRFRPPEPPACRAALFEAKTLAPACPQLDGDTFVGAEDCLALNVWAPTSAGPHAVLVFLHGGGNIQGSARETLPGGGLIYDGQYLARPPAADGSGGGEVVVVTVQYRLGALGWLVHPALSAEDVIDTLGNRGLLDQQAALRWVRDNIASFGGDPQRVLLFGESAGAVDTSLHVALPSSQGLFQAAIIQSGSPVVRTLEAASEAGQAAVADTSCGSASDIAACLRALPVEDLVRALPGSIGIGSVSLGNAAGSYGPVLDGRFLSDTPLALIRAQRAAPGSHPAVVVGSNSEELAELLAVPVPTAEAYETIVRTNLAVPIAARTGQPVAEVTATLLATYPVASYPTPRDALVDVYTDLRFTCPAVELLAALETPSSATTNPRRYLFARRAEGRNGELPASHGRELLYVFGSWRNIPLYDPTDADRRVSSAMLGAWASLAAQSDRPAPAPTVPLVGGWPSWSASLGSTLVFDDPLAVEVAPREDRCAMWRDLATP